MSKSVLEFALEYIRAGYSIIPIRADGSKAPPCAWKEYQTKPPSEEQARIWWGPEAVITNGPLGIAAVCGLVSHSLHLLDFDVEPVKTYSAFEDIVAAEQPDLMGKLCVVRTPSGGFHLWMRCRHVEIPGNQKLANLSPEEADRERSLALIEDRKARTCLVETRGTGGYALVVGSPGCCHVSGREYEVGFGSMLALSDITAEQHEFLIGLARRFDRGTPDPEPIPIVPGADLKPGEDLDRSSFPWSRILEPAGWKLQSGHEGSEMRWKRPGKKEAGHSATTGHCFSNGCDLLRVFSSEAAPFDTKPYGKFRAMTLLHFNGDFSACAKHLHREGLGSAPSGGRAHAGASTGGAPPNGKHTATGGAAGDGANNASASAGAGLDNMLDLEPVVVNMSEVEAESVKWLWHSWLPLGMLAVLDGDPGTGKSQLTLDLAARITRGYAMPYGGNRQDKDNPFAGSPTDPDARVIDPTVRPGGVLLMSAEDVLTCTIRPRLDEAGADCSRVFSFTEVMRGQGKDRKPRPAELPKDLDLITLDFVRRHHIRLIVIDPLTAFLAGEYNAFRDQDVRRGLAPMASLAARLGVSILLIRHLNKLSGGPALYRGGSSIAIIGAARSGLLVGRHPTEKDEHGQAIRVLACNKPQLCPMPMSLKYQIVTAGDMSKIKWLGGCDLYPDDILGNVQKSEKEPGMGTPGRPPTRATAATMFLQELLKNGRRTVAQMIHEATEQGISKRTLERARDQLGVIGFKIGDVNYVRLPIPGVQAADTPEDDAATENHEHPADIQNDPPSKPAVSLFEESPPGPGPY